MRRLALLVLVIGVGAAVWLTPRFRAGGRALEKVGDWMDSRAARMAWSVPFDLRGDRAPAGSLGRLGTSRLRHGGPVRSVAFSPGGRALASAGDDGTVSLWDPETGLETRRLAAWAPVREVAFSADGARLTAATQDGTVWLWDAASGGVTDRRVLGVPEGPRAGTPARSPDGRTLATGQADGTIVLRHVATGAVLAVLEGHHGLVHALAFSPDGRRLASGGDDGSVRLFDLERGAEAAVSVGPGGAVTALAFSPDGRALASAHGDGSVRTWARGATPLGALRGERAPWQVHYVAPSRLLVVESDRARLVDATSHQPLEEIAFPPGSRGVAVAPAAGRLAVGGDAIRIFTLGAGEPKTLALPAPEEALAFSRDGRGLATLRRGASLAEHTLVLRDADTGRVLGREAHRMGGPHPAACPSSDGRHLLFNGSLLRADSEGAPHLDTLAWPGRGDLCVVSKDDTLVALRTWDQTQVQVLQTWHHRPEARQRTVAWLRGHRGPVTAVALSPDGTVLATGGRDASIVLWDVAAMRSAMPYLAEVPAARWPPERPRAERGAGTEVAIPFEGGLAGRGIHPLSFPDSSSPVRSVEGRVGRAAVLERGVDLPETQEHVLGDEFTFATWLSLEAVPAAPAIAAVVRSSVVSLEVREGGRPYLFFHFAGEGGHAHLDLTPWTGGPLVAGRWYHVAASYRRAKGDLRVCVDGGCGPGPRGFNYADRVGVLRLGGDRTDPVPVGLDELLIRDSALSDSEMAALALQPAPRRLPTPKPAAGPPAEAVPEPPLREDVGAFVTLERRADFDVYRFEGPLSRVEVHDVEVAGGRVWAGTSRGLLEHDLRAGTWRLFGTDSGVPGEWLHEIGAVAGRVVADVGEVTSPGIAKGLGAHVFDPDRRAWAPFDASGSISSLEGDGSALWIGGSAGAEVRHVDPASPRPRVEEGSGRSFTRARGQLRHDDVLDVAWSGRTVWFALPGAWVERKGFEGGGVSVWARDQDRFTSYGREDGLADGYVCALAVDEREAWAAHWTEERGLSRLDRTRGRWEAVLRSVEGIDVGGVALALDGESVWVGQQRGLLRLDRRRRAATRYQRAEGLPGHIVAALATTEDAVWAAVYGSHGSPGGAPGEAGLVRVPRRAGPESLPAR